MEITLRDIMQRYLDDAQYLEEMRARASKRDATLPSLKRITQAFIRQEITLRACRDQIDALTREQERWGLQGRGFMGTLSLFIKYHDEEQPVVEPFLRNVLLDINAENMGARLEALYLFLREEQTRLRREGKSSGMTAAPGNSALVISAFTTWLDPEHWPVIYHDGVRRGICLLYRAGLLPKPLDLVVNNETVEVKTEANHQACLQALNYLDSRIKLNLYWPEFFLYWVLDHFHSLTEPSTVLIKEAGETALLATQAQPIGVAVREASPEYALTFPEMAGRDDETTLLPPGPLKSTPEALLTRLMREVQRRILVDEATIRRVYQALLGGHVILTGPPGTGKTELARLLPEILWQSRCSSEDQREESQEQATWDTRTAYTTRLVTAHSEWSVRTLIGGIAPQQQPDGSLTYTIQYGHLTTTILKNWSFNSHRPDEWNALRRTTSLAPSGVERGIQKLFRGQWLVIDEFNRAPIDVALGEALTALSSNGHEALRVPIEGGTAELPIPQDFRIIGTLNSFDRTFLNQMSEALKRRFAFIEILPLTRAHYESEQAIVLYKALSELQHLDEGAIEKNEAGLGWHDGALSIDLKDPGHYAISWDVEDHPFRSAFEAAWRTFEVLRIYRQMGTAQALSFVRQILIAGLVQGYTTHEQWLEQAVDIAFCDTLTDQLQVLLPDEIDALWSYLTGDPAQFPRVYNDLLAGLTRTRVHAQLLRLGSVTHRDGRPLMTDQEIDQVLAQEIPTVPDEYVKEAFHLAYPVVALPQFARRLRTFKVERGL